MLFRSGYSGKTDSSAPNERPVVHAETDSEEKKEEPKLKKVSQSTSVPHPAPEQPTKLQKPRGHVNRISSIRLSDMGLENNTDNSNEPDAEFTDEQFEEAWNIYMYNNPDKHILLSAMRAAKKKRTGESSYTISVELPQLKAPWNHLTAICFHSFANL